MMQERIRTERIREHVTKLASDIGERNLYQYDGLAAAAAFIDRSWGALDPVDRGRFPSGLS